MNNEEKILSILETLILEVKEINSKVDNIEVRFDKLETKVDKLDIRMGVAEKQAARNLDFIIDEFERSDKRILGHLKDMALNEAGEPAKESLGLA